MASPFVRTDAEGYILSDFGKITDVYGYLAELAAHRAEAASAAPDVIATHPNGGTKTGSLNNEDGGDLIAVNLVAGQTYTFDYRGAGDNGIVDPWLQLLGADQTTLIAEDDDGGLGRSSQITHTATATGTYYLRATSWYQIDPTAPDYQDNGDYAINIWSPEADVGATRATATAIDVGTTYGNLDFAGDRDLYRIDLTEGMVYTFTYNGGISGGSDWDDAPGESIGVLTLFDANGATVVPPQVNYETGLTFVAQQSGTYYVRAQAYSDFAGPPAMTGGYTLDVREVALEDMDPLESLNWDSADNIPTVTDPATGRPTAYVYFAPAGQNFGELADDGVTPMTTYGWQQHQIDAVMHALQTQYTPITGIQYAITTDVNQATFRLLTTNSEDYGAYFYPQDEATYGDAQGIGVFNLLSGGFGTRPESLEPGGFSYAVILHEFGHAHGVAHPHDTGGGSEVMLGVTAATGSYGLYNLNQGVYTVMSYNDAWDFHPDGPTTEHPEGRIGAVIDRGWSETLGAFDIAVLQARYGVHAHNTGDNVYMLNDDYTEGSYKTIWDTGGSDTIAYNGALAAQIDLTAATLDYSPTGGGVVSFLYNTAQPDYTTELKGGYTIANGVVIENATGGSGNDILIGNDAANTLTGNAGDDFLMGGKGGDRINGGAGFDTASYRTSEQGVKVNLQGSADGGDARGDRLISIEALEGSNHNDVLGGSNANDTLKGLGGNDLLEAGNGNDTLDGGAGDDHLKGDNGIDKLFGGDGIDFLEGGNDNDVINGGAGNDRLSGGNGADRFVFAEGGEDRIIDFNRGDIIDFSNFLGVTRSDVTITRGKIFVENGDNDLTIFIEGASIRESDLVFAPAAATANAEQPHIV